MERNVKKIFAEEVKTNLEPLYDYEKYPLGTLDYHLAKAKHHLKNAEMLIATGGTVYKKIIPLHKFTTISCKSNAIFCKKKAKKGGIQVKETKKVH